MNVVYIEEISDDEAEGVVDNTEIDGTNPDLTHPTDDDIQIIQTDQVQLTEVFPDVPSHSQPPEIPQHSTSVANWSFERINGKVRPSGRGGCSLTRVGNNLYMFGGADQRQNHFNDFWMFDLNKKSWARLKPRDPSPSPRCGHTMVLFEDKLVLFGGISYTTEECFNDVWEFNLTSRTWSLQLCNGPIPSPRNAHSAILLGSAMVIYGGSSPSDSIFSDIYQLDLQSKEWSLLFTGSPTPEYPAGREMHIAAPCGRSMIIQGGRDESMASLKDIWQWDYDTRQWTQVNSGIEASLRASHTGSIIPTKSMLVAFGGWNGIDTLYDGVFAYDLPMREWSEQGDQASIPPRFGCASTDVHEVDASHFRWYIFGGIRPGEDLSDLIVANVSFV